MTTATGHPPITRPWWAWPAGGVAILFGLASLWSGGSVLLGGELARQTAGAYVPFVVWFNFLAGFAYVAAGGGLALWRRWSAILALAIAVATVAVAAAFGLHVASGGAYEMRTVGALALRSTVWISIATLACSTLGCRSRAA